MDKNVEKLKLILTGEVTEDSDLDVGMECRICDWETIAERFNAESRAVMALKQFCGKTFRCTLQNVKDFKNCGKSAVVVDGEEIFIYNGMYAPVAVKGKRLDVDIKYKYAFRVKDKDPKIIDEMISLVNREEVKTLLGYYGCTSNVKDNVVDEYIRMWANAKYEFYLMFGKNLKFVRPVNIPASDKEIGVLFNELKCRYPFHSTILDYFSIGDIKANKCPDNEVLKNNIEIYKPGMKISKFLHQYFLDDKFDIDVSKVLQNKVISGQFCISIDPIDYLMSSTNKNNWTTCMTPGHGAQSNGCVAYMIDDSGIVAYQCNGNDYEYRFPTGKIVTNSKMFRAYVLVNKDNGTFFIHRGYPDNEIISQYKIIKEFVQEAIENYFGIKDAEWYVAENNKGKKSNSPDFGGLYELRGTARVAIDSTKEYTNRIGQFAWKDPVKYACSLEDVPIDKVTFGVPYLICPVCGRHVNKYGNNGNLSCCKG